MDRVLKKKAGFSRCDNPHHIPCHRDFEWACLQHSVATAARILVGKDTLEEILFYCPPKYLHQSDLQEVWKIPIVRRLLRYNVIDVGISEDDLNQAMHKIFNKDRGVFLFFSESKVLVARGKNNSQEIIGHTVVYDAGFTENSPKSKHGPPHGALIDDRKKLCALHDHDKKTVSKSVQKLQSFTRGKCRKTILEVFKNVNYSVNSIKYYSSPKVKLRLQGRTTALYSMKKVRTQVSRSASAKRRKRRKLLRL